MLFVCVAVLSYICWCCCSNAAFFLWWVAKWRVEWLVDSSKERAACFFFVGFVIPCDSISLLPFTLFGQVNFRNVGRIVLNVNRKCSRFIAFLFQILWDLNNFQSSGTFCHVEILEFLPLDFFACVTPHCHIMGVCVSFPCLVFLPEWIVPPKFTRLWLQKQLQR